MSKATPLQRDMHWQWRIHVYEEFYILSDNHIAALQPVWMIVDSVWYIGAYTKRRKFFLA